MSKSPWLQPSTGERLSPPLGGDSDGQERCRIRIRYSGLLACYLDYLAERWSLDLILGTMNQEKYLKHYQFATTDCAWKISSIVCIPAHADSMVIHLSLVHVHPQWWRNINNGSRVRCWIASIFTSKFPEWIIKSWAETERGKCRNPFMSESNVQEILAKATLEQ